MATRRSRGEGGVHFSESRQRWIATAQVGFHPDGKRIVKTGTGRTKTEAKDKLQKLIRDHRDGISVAARMTVASAIEDWLEFGLAGRSAKTITTCRILANGHVIPDLGARKVQELTAEDVDRWLKRKAPDLSRATLQRILSILRRALSRQVARDRLRRNVALHCEVPQGRKGRPSRALTFEQAAAVLAAARGTDMNAYITLSLVTGARTEELRALTWAHLDLTGDLASKPLRPPTIQVWRSVRETGDTKTKRSRRTLRLPTVAVEALTLHKLEQDRRREAAGDNWTDNDLVFCTDSGLALDSANVRRAFRSVVRRAGLVDGTWTPRELRHSFVSILSEAGVPLEEIARLVGHRSTTVTEAVYRKQLRPVLTEGAEAMDRIFVPEDVRPRPDSVSTPEPDPKTDP
ncbi:site-specific integrase [Pedococcus aerophilus]|uniref:Site-specific integrase n=1 Tax=Pedococcus aerophilus TaxID=436356 RepID=A0ABP6GYX6_9MICO